MSTAYLSPVASLPGASADATRSFSWSDSFQRNSYFGLVGLTALLTYSFWNTLEGTSAFWQTDQYSHGWLVPLIALYLLWSWRPNPAAHEPPEGTPQETFLGLMPASQFGWVGVGVGAALTGAGVALGVPLLQGAGIATLCLAGLAYVLLGQPFAPVGSGERWAGLAVLLAAYALRVMLGAGLYMEPVSRLSFVLALLGAFLMIGGLGLLRWAGAGVGFLLFMFPLPTELEGRLLLTLQKLAAFASEVVLTILNQPVVREGNKIFVDGFPLEVAEACSGLRMVTIFGGFAVACALLMNRPWWDKLIVLLSAIPIALVVNVTRIVVTALLFRYFSGGDGETLFGWGSEAIQQQFHDLPGYIMMFLAMGLLYLELRVLSMLSVEDEGIEAQQSGLGGLSMFGPGSST